LICFGLCNHLSLFSSWSALVVHHHLFISLDLFVMWWCIIQCRGRGIWRQTLPTVVWRVCWSRGSSGWVCVVGRALSTQKRLIPISLPMLKCSMFLHSSSCCSLVIAEFLSLHNIWLQALHTSGEPCLSVSHCLYVCVSWGSLNLHRSSL
jgi:hypothetical protein